jgi:hypothetical protein
MPWPFSEIMVGDKFMFKDEDLIRVKTGPTTCRLTGEAYVGDGKFPEELSEPGKEISVNLSTKVTKLLDLAEMVEQIQHEIWEISVAGDESYSEVLDRVIENSAECEEADLVHKVAVMIRNARNEGHDGIKIVE